MKKKLEKTLKKKLEKTLKKKLEKKLKKKLKKKKPKKKVNLKNILKVLKNFQLKKKNGDIYQQQYNYFFMK